jgi:hypothetical protein
MSAMHLFLAAVGAGLFGAGYYTHYRYGSKLASVGGALGAAANTIKKDL